MYEGLLGMDLLVTITILITWAMASWQLGKAARRSTRRGVVRAAVWAIVWLIIGGLPVLAFLLLTAMIGAHGMQFAVGGTLFALPMVVVPAVLSYLWTFPAVRRLLRAARGLADGAEGAVLVEERAAVAHLQQALPPRLTALGGAFGFWMLYFYQPVVPLWDDILGYAVAFGLLAGVQVVKLRGAPAKVVAGAAFPGVLSRTVRSGLRIVVFIALVVGVSIWSSSASKLPDRYTMVDHGGAHPAGHGRPVTELTGGLSGPAQARFTLTAQVTELTLSSGAKTEAWTFDGTAPGPMLRVEQNALVEVELINKDIPRGVSIHWHGVDVINAADGVPGLTQDAVPAGGRYVYRFRAPDVGTYWYHSHQVSAEQVRMGLYGAFIVDPAKPADTGGTTEFPVLVHTFADQLQVLNASDELRREPVRAGTPIRLRLINTDRGTHRFTLTGTPFRVTAIDGSAINEPTELTGVRLAVGGGGRYDVEFSMPSGPVRLVTADRPDTGLLISPDGTGDVAAQVGGEEFDPTTYGRPAPTPFDARSSFSHDDTYYIDNRFGFFNGQFAMLYTLNGEVYPDAPATVVREGELVRFRFINRSFDDHPMHVHGHHMLVLSRNGNPATGSPLWLDTVLVQPGETWEVALKADNPGLWMDHCHNLAHAATGMSMHLTYEGYTTPYQAGSATPNQPE